MVMYPIKGDGRVMHMNYRRYKGYVYDKRRCKDNTCD